LWRAKIQLIFLLILGMCALSHAQTRRDPRCMALGGAYGSLARGIFAVDYNPANLAIPHEYDSYRIWGGLGTSFSTNFLSINQYKKYNGQNLEAGDGSLKDEFMADISEDGWRIYSDFYLPVPYVSHSTYNRAVSADFIIVGDLGLPRGLLKFVFDENPLGQTLDLDFQEETMAVMQYGYSIAFPVKGVYVGLTAKYLQGLAYFGLNPDSSYGEITTYFDPERNYIAGGGQYYFQQSLGGRGFALDLGLTTQEINGYRFGLSLTNLFGYIFWNKSTLFSRLLDAGSVLPWNGDFFKYEYTINEARFDRFFGKSSLNEVFGGKGHTFSDSATFRMRYPSLVRFSVSKILEENLTLASDLVVGFEDRLYSFGAWKWCLGIESTKSPRHPIRAGIALGGKQHILFNFGSGFRWGFIHLDWALGFNHGLWPTTATGLNFSLMGYTTKKAKSE